MQKWLGDVVTGDVILLDEYVDLILDQSRLSESRFASQ